MRSYSIKKACLLQIDELKREKEFLEAAFESEKADLATEKRKNLSLADQLKDRDRRLVVTCDWPVERCLLKNNAFTELETFKQNLT